MLYEKIQLTENAYLETYVANQMLEFTRKAILVIPGGGYAGLSDREGEPIAQAFMPYGYNAFVLHYSCKEKPFPQQLIEASMAMKHIRDNVEKYNIDPQEVFAVGFSAGGHLTACLGTMWDRPEIYDVIDMPMGYNKPNGMMLIYPVINPDYHYGSFENLFMGDVTPEKLREVSIDKVISESSSPAFIMHSSNDEVVNIKNSLCLADAMADKGIKFEMHIYPDAPHGIALGNEITKYGIDKWCDTSIAKWVEQAVEWADKHSVEV